MPGPMRCSTPKWLSKRSSDLQPDFREIVVMRIWGELGFAEIAGVMGLSVSTVHTRYVAAIKQLRAALEKPCQEHDEINPADREVVESLRSLVPTAVRIDPVAAAFAAGRRSAENQVAPLACDSRDAASCRIRSVVVAGRRKHGAMKFVHSPHSLRRFRTNRSPTHTLKVSLHCSMPCIGTASNRCRRRIFPEPDSIRVSDRL